MKLRESVARAIVVAESIGGVPSATNAGWSERISWVPGQDKYERMANAAILAMFNHLAANVSEGMLDAGRMHFGNQFIDMIEQAKREYEEAKG